MSKLLIFNLIVCLLVTIYAEYREEITQTDLLITPNADVSLDDDSSQDVIESIENFEQKASVINKAETDVPIEEPGTIYEEMLTALEDIIDLLNENRKNVYVFLKAKGIDRVIVTNLLIENTSLRTKLLMLLKILFNVAPTTTRAMIPIFTVDNLLDIFEDDDHLPSKAHTLDILCIWLPENPRVQARVMKIKGLEPFYNQINKLDASVVYSLLELFNKILNEHLKVRNENLQRNKADLEKLKIYQKIGLIESITSPDVCNGILSVFETAWSYSLNNEEVLIPVFDLIKKIKPFCLKNISRKMIGRATELFKNFLKHVEDKHVEDIEAEEARVDGVDLNEMALVLKEYIDTLKQETVKEDL